MSFPNLAASRYDFEAQPGYFVYTDDAIDNSTLPAIADNFGLVKDKTWRELVEDIQARNRRSEETGEVYKLVYAARHGEGHHNVAEAKYGTKAWDDHWSLLNGDGELVWGPDPSLTSVGEGQAHDARRIWNNLLSEGKADLPPLPGAYFSSPMIRSAKTLYLTFEGRTPAKPVVILESIREDFKDRHTCDERSKRSVVAAEWEPRGWIVDAKMDEEDTLFQSDYRETHETMAQRLADALSDIFDRTEGIDVVNITSHSGVMQALFRAVHHDDFKPKTGGMVPLLIKGTLKAGKKPNN